MDRARNIALKCLYEINEESSYSNIILDKYINENRKYLKDIDINFISELVYGTITWKLTLEFIIQKYSKIKLKKMSGWVRNILLLGAYQIVFLDKIPKSAAVNESVKLCQKYNFKSKALVNAILRKIDKKDYALIVTDVCNKNSCKLIDLKMFEELDNNLDNNYSIKENHKDSELIQLSLKYSMPLWIVEKLKNQYGFAKAEEICKNSNLRPNVSIRINALKSEEIQKDIDKEIFKEENSENEIQKRFKIDLGTPAILDDFRIMNKGVKTKNLMQSLEYKEGFISIQDEGAGLIVDILNPEENEKILDACSAPGGKTTYIAEKMRNKGEVIALELYKERAKKVEENANRLGVNIIQTKTADASELNKDYVNYFDKIILDVPCLGIGVIRRKPEIKWNRSIENLEEIRNTQTKILDTCSKYLKLGGELVYSTCSLLKEENEEIIQKFLQKNNEKFQIINDIKIQEGFNYIENNGMIQLFPNEKHDGFFISKLKRIK